MRLFHQSVIVASLLACLALVFHPTPAPAATGPGGGVGGSATNAQPPNTTLTNVSRTGVTIFATNALVNELHTNAATYAFRLGITNRAVMERQSGFWWEIQNNGLLSAVEDVIFLRGGQNSETNSTRYTFKGGLGTLYGSITQNANGILVGAGGYDFSVADCSTNFTLLFSGQTGVGQAQTSFSYPVSYNHSTGATNFSIGLSHAGINTAVLVRSNASTVFANYFFQDNQNNYLVDYFPFPFIAGFGYQRSGLVTNWQGGHIRMNTNGVAPLTGLSVITVGGRFLNLPSTHDLPWVGTVHEVVVLNRQLSQVEHLAVERAMRWLAPSENNRVFVGDSMTAWNYLLPGSAFNYQLFVGGWTNTGQFYDYSQSGRTVLQMISLWPDGPSTRKPHGKVKTADAIIFGGANELLADTNGPTTFARLSNLWFLARSDGFKVHASTIPPSSFYTTSMESNRTVLNSNILANPKMYDVLYRRDLLLSVTNETGMFVEGLHPATNGNARLAQDMVMGGTDGWGRALPVYPTGAGAGKVLTSDANGVMTLETPSSVSGSTQMVVAAIGDLTVTNTITQLGSGAAPASSSYFETNGSKYFQFLSPNQITDNGVLRLPSHFTSGVMVALPDGTGTNKWTNITLTAGQYVTYNGSAYVASNLPSASLSFLGDWYANNIVSNVVGGAFTTNKMTVGAGSGVPGGSDNRQARQVPYAGTIRGLMANSDGAFTDGNVSFEVFTNDVSTGVNVVMTTSRTNVTANVAFPANIGLEVRYYPTTNLVPNASRDVNAVLILEVAP